jgi:hypothetical protein
MFDANGDFGGTDNNIAEDTRLFGYDPMIPPALIQQEIPTVLPSSNLSLLDRRLTQSPPNR